MLYYARYSNPEPPRQVELPEAEWRARLTPEQYRVLCEGHPELPYRNAYCRRYEPGTYACAGCGSGLFEAATKYHGMSGWPSFTHPAAKSAISYYHDNSHPAHRGAVQRVWRAPGARVSGWAGAEQRALLHQLSQPGAAGARATLGRFWG